MEHLQIHFSRCYRILLALVFCIVSSSLLADQLEKQRFLYLSQQKNDFSFLIKQALIPLPLNLQGEAIRKKAKANEDSLLLLREKIVSIKEQLHQENQHIAVLQKTIKDLQKSTARVLTHPEVEASLQQLKDSVNLCNSNRVILEDTLMLAFQYESILITKHRKLRLMQAKEQYNQAIKRIQTDQDFLAKNLTDLYADGMQLQQLLHTEKEPDKILANEKKILLNNKSIDFIQSQLSLLELNQHWMDAEFALQKNPTMSSLEATTQIYRDGIDALIKQEANLKEQLNLLNILGKRFATPDLKPIWSSLVDSIKTKIREIGVQEQTLEEDLAAQQDALSKQLSMRTHLPDLSSESWISISKQLTIIPLKFVNYLKQLFLRVWDNYGWQDWIFKFFFWLEISFPILVVLGLRPFIKQAIVAPVPQRLIKKVYRGILILFWRNIFPLTLLAVWWVAFYVNDVPFTSYALLFSLVLVYVFFHLLGLISHLVLIDKDSDISEHDLHLHHNIKYLLNVGMLTTILLVFSHQYPLNFFVQELFNRLFMLYLVVIAFVAFKSRQLITQLIAPVLNTKKRYIKNFILLLMMIVPATLLTTAVIGLLGYQNLAWSLSKFQAQFLSLLAAYMLIRGLMIDVLELISEWMIASLYNGWLWIEALLKPLDNLLRFFLFMAFLFAVIKLIDSYLSYSIATMIFSFSDYTLIKSPGIEITVISVVYFIALLFLFIWLAKWTREFCYRWLYKQINDVGIRNSFSVFTQYTVITIGFFVTVRVLGFDFAGLSLILGGLAVGMGFGLRDFASNIVGGLTLLIERPVREGDLITIGDFEGRVEHIGIRSMRVCSWDNKEVLIPNAETFNKPFTNWTHQNSIVRTVVPIKASRFDDPEKVHKILLESLEHIPEILSTPAPEVFLTQIDEVLLSFEIRYFVNINLHTRFAIRSKLLFYITTLFKEAGLNPPTPSLHVELANLKNKQLDE
ncbi:MAG: hypothetical protein A3F18_01450 [Legionellales bacterium RIFCSPHIGHO2_12_FULL_37_14]|nr:MAG: hypothetical protein A3F18_01450 [Legionellales bacterium RIFCSPHIGHO2_12_FULL_37_14]